MNPWRRSFKNPAPALNALAFHEDYEAILAALETSGRANEVAAPIFIATMTTVAAFFPMLLGLKGSTKEYIYSLPVTISVDSAMP